MHLKMIACEILSREIFYCAARALNTVDLTLLTEGLHDNSDVCREQLQAHIDSADADKFGALLLGYGLCNNSTVGIRAVRVPTVVARAHDCITLFLGSKERYAKLFAQQPGTYYHTSGWLEYESRGGKRVDYSHKSGLAKRMVFEELVDKYGEENARYLIETMSNWEVNYTHGALIQFPFTRKLGLAAKVQAICKEKGWEYCEIKGSLRLIQDGLDGRWDPKRFLVLQPGEEIRARYDDEIIESAPSSPGTGAQA